MPGHGNRRKNGNGGGGGGGGGGNPGGFGAVGLGVLEYNCPPTTSIFVLWASAGGLEGCNQSEGTTFRTSARMTAAGLSSPPLWSLLFGPDAALR